MNTQVSVKAALVALSSAVLFSCQKADTNTSDQKVALNDFVKSLPSVEQKTPFEERLVTFASPKTNRPVLGEIIPVSSEKQQYEQAKEFEEQLLFSDDQEIFYPGALVKAKTVIDGSYLPIVAPRRPITLSVSLQGKKPSITVENPRLSSVRTALGELLEREFQTPPANISYSYEEVHDEQHLKIALGGSYNGSATQVSASAGFKYDKETTRFLVKIQQVFYTVDLDSPEKPSDFFSDNFDYQNAFGDVKPVYISSIKMGRVLLLGIETSLSKREAEAKINASIMNKTFNAEASAAYNDLSKHSKITGRVLGGDPKLAGKAITSIEHIKEFVTDGATFSKENPGIPIAYKLRELGTNKTFKTVIYSKYFKKNNNERLSFDLLVRDNMRTISGANKKVYVGIIRRINKKGFKSEDEFSFYGKNNTATKSILTYESGEKLEVEFRQDNELITFDLTSELDKLLKGYNIQNGQNLYPINDGGLPIKDKNDKYVLRVGIHNAKLE